MSNLIERDEKIEAKTGVYYFGRRVFLILLFLTAIALAVFSYTYESQEGVEGIFSTFIGVTLFWFFAYKLADYRVQHIETIKYHKDHQTGAGGQIT